MQGLASRGNYLELLSLRAKDLPGVKWKNSPVSFFGNGKGHGTEVIHPSIQNEMMEILSSHCLTKMIESVKSEENKHHFYSIRDSYYLLS